MSEMEDPEDRKIRIILIGIATAAAAGFLLLVTLVTVMISANFNILEWME